MVRRYLRIWEIWMERYFLLLWGCQHTCQNLISYFSAMGVISLIKTSTRMKYVQSSKKWTLNYGFREVLSFKHSRSFIIYYLYDSTLEWFSLPFCTLIFIYCVGKTWLRSGFSPWFVFRNYFWITTLGTICCAVIIELGAAACEANVYSSFWPILCSF